MKSTSLLTCLLFALPIQSLEQIVFKGNKLFKESGERFLISGVAYQPSLEGDGDRNHDPLADPETCKRDIPYLKELGINTVRVYQIDNSKNHDECMKELEDAGIYLMLDFSTPKFSINREEPTYTTYLLNHFKETVDVFAKYPNTMAFLCGNEVSNDNSNTQASAFVKASCRDIKAYIKANSDRNIPVGYASNDDPDIREPLMEYFNCGEEEERIDFFGYQVYSWCGESSIEESGFKDHLPKYASYSIPTILTEYGCNLVRPRPFTEVSAIYGEDMKDVFNGGIVYEYSEEDNKYGLVKIKNGKVETLEDYDNLKEQLQNIDLSSDITLDSYDDGNSPDECPALDKNWKASPKLPPTPSDEVCSCFMDSASCIVDTSNENWNDTSSGIGPAVDFVCADISCDEISTDAEEGTYGQYSFCDAPTKASWAFNAYFNSNNGDSRSCSFDGLAKTEQPKLTSDESCSDIQADPTSRSTSNRSDSSSASISSTTYQTITALSFVSLAFSLL